MKDSLRKRERRKVPRTLPSPEAIRATLRELADAVRELRAGVDVLIERRGQHGGPDTELRRV